MDLLKENLKKHSSAKAFLVEGFPRNKEQVEAFNKCVSNSRVFVLLKKIGHVVFLFELSLFKKNQEPN